MTSDMLSTTIVDINFSLVVSRHIYCIAEVRGVYFTFCKYCIIVPVQNTESQSFGVRDVEVL